MMDTEFGFPTPATHAPMQRKILQDLNSCKVFEEDPASAGRIASFCSRGISPKESVAHQSVISLISAVVLKFYQNTVVIFFSLKEAPCESRAPCRKCRNFCYADVHMVLFWCFVWCFD
jgi:hypothetical protein